MKRQIKNIIILLAICVGISAVAMAILWGTGVIYYDSGFHFSVELFDSFRNTWYIYPIFLIIQIVVTTVLCFVPGTSALMIALGVILFGAGWKSFVVCASGVYLSSFSMYAAGRFGGYRLVEKMLGKEDTDKATELLRKHGQLYFPVCLACAGFPDDALVMIAGVMKMNLPFFTASVVIGRGIGIATICFGVQLLPEITCIWDFIEVATVCAFWLIVVFYLTHKLNVWIEKRREK